MENGNPNNETKRVLDMVESGRLTAAEGARLLNSTQPHAAGGDLVCPYCAETIARGTETCPECGSHLNRPAEASVGPGFQALTGLGKFLVVYIFLAAGLNLLSLFAALGVGAVVGSLLSALGLAAAVLMLKGEDLGWGLGMLWAAAQIVTVILSGEIINQQLFHIGINFHTNGQGLGVNLIGVVLLILFIKAKPANN